jgi:hypothetical protein
MRADINMRIMFAILLFALSGCLKPESASGPEQNPNPLIEDPDLRAGATSSTNWPQEDAHPRQLNVGGQADSVLKLFFRDLLTPYKLSGRLTFYRGGAIPALESVATRSLVFSDTDTVLVEASVFSSLAREGRDTVSFSIRVESDTAQAFCYGFTYSIKQKAFLSSPFSSASARSASVTNPRYYFRGKADTSLLSYGPSDHGKSEWCFYIPGSPYFWKVKIGDSLEIGPLPSGTYPIRLIRIIKPDASLNKSLLELYEVELFKTQIDSAHHEVEQIIRVGKKILSSEVPSSFSIRSESI